MRTRSVLSLVLVIALMGVASAEPIGVSLARRSSDAYISSEETAGLVPQANWNVLFADGVGAGDFWTLEDAAGDTAGTLTTKENPEERENPVYLDNIDDSNARMLQQFWRADVDIDIDLDSALPADGGRLILYVHGNYSSTEDIHIDWGADGTEDVLLDDVSQFPSDKSSNNPDGDPVGTFYEFDPVVAFSTGLFYHEVAIPGGVQSINLQISDFQGGDTSRGALNSIQIVPIPEPATMAMLGIGGLAALLRRRKA